MQKPGRDRRVKMFHRAVQGTNYMLPVELSSVVITPSSPKYNHEGWIFSLTGRVHPNYRGAVKKIILSQLNRIRIIKIEASRETSGLSVRIWTEVGVICISFPKVETAGVWNISFIPFDDPIHYESLRGGGWQLSDTQLSEADCVAFRQPHIRSFEH